MPGLVGRYASPKVSTGTGGFGEGCDVVPFFVGWLCFYCVKHVNLDIFDAVNVVFFEICNECCYLVILPGAKSGHQG